MSKKEGEGDKNPVLRVIGGVEIRETNSVRIKYNQHEYARLVRQSLITGLSVAKIVALSSQPCTVCGNDHVDVMVPLGLVSAKKQPSISPNSPIYKNSLENQKNQE